jgi:hypothetical protein
MGDRVVGVDLERKAVAIAAQIDCFAFVHQTQRRRLARQACLFGDRGGVALADDVGDAEVGATAGPSCWLWFRTRGAPHDLDRLRRLNRIGRRIAAAGQKHSDRQRRRP